MDETDEATVRFGDGQVELQVPDKWILGTCMARFRTSGGHV